MVLGPQVHARHIQTDQFGEDLPDDFPIEYGHHYTQGANTAYAGYEIRNQDDARWWDAYRRLGGMPVVGPPVGVPFALGGFEYQTTRYGLLQRWVARDHIGPANALEIMDRAGHTEWLYQARQVPRPIEDDGSSSHAEASDIRLGWLTHDAFRTAFEQNPNPVGQLTWTKADAVKRWGLPMSAHERRGPFMTQRFQRGVFQLWLDDLPNMPDPGSVVPLPVGEFMRDTGSIPETALRPVDSLSAMREAQGHRLGDRLHAAIVGRLAGEPGKWAVYAAPSGSQVPEVAIDIDVVVPAASLWKLALLVETYRQRAVMGLNVQTQLTMNNAVLQRVDPPASLAPGEHVTISKALERAITISDNTTAILLGDRLGYLNMSGTLAGLGLTATNVATRHTVTTARETAMLLEVAVGMRPPNWHCTLADVRGMRSLLLAETRNQRIPERLPLGTPVAHKTGDLLGVSNDAGVVYASTGPVTLVILVRDAPFAGRAAATSAEIAAMVVSGYDPLPARDLLPVG